MENHGKQDYGDIGSEDFPDEFQCCVCLDSMYKPVVLACGCISCFWCIFKAMDHLQESLCPMYPIIGERYKCKDCVEEIGFDLCEGCYKSSSKLPGRFNQQHTPEHQFEILEPPTFRGLLLSLEAVHPEEHDTSSPDIAEEVVTVTNLSNDASQHEVDSAASLNLSPDAFQDIGNAIASPAPFNNPSEDQDGNNSGT